VTAEKRRKAETRKTRKLEERAVVVLANQKFRSKKEKWRAVHAGWVSYSLHTRRATKARLD